MRRGIATFTLYYGKCPRRLFERLVKPAREMTGVLVAQFGPGELIRRIGDPVWFQALVAEIRLLEKNILPLCKNT